MCITKLVTVVHILRQRCMQYQAGDRCMYSVTELSTAVQGCRWVSSE